MKKLIAIAAFAVFFAGCDIVSGDADGAVASVANITITDASLGGSSDIYVEVQDAAGRAYSQTSHSGVSLPLSLGAQFEVHSASRDMFIVVMRDNGSGSFSASDIIGASDAFDGNMLAAAAGSSLQVGGAVSAEISVAGSAE
ncbi:MAG: hypothetical protein R3284_09900 [Rubricoccaceae bacterium]|nr:hypothetical protein [Rubricoccaceae bacterium]